MHAVILILLALAIWVMGYRFYGKFLRLGILQLHEEFDVPAVARAGDPEFEPRGRWTVSAFHAAASTGLLSLIGAAIAVVWGWVPAFLWVLLGGMVAASVLAVGVLWTTVRRSGDTLAGVAFDLTGLPAALALFFLGVVLLILVGSVLGMVLGGLVHAHPETTWPFLSLFIVGGWLRADRPRAPLIMAAGVALFAAAWFSGQYFPLSLAGNWTFSVRGVEVVSLRHELIWAVIALAIAYRAACGRASESTHGRGILAAGLTVSVMALFLIGTATQGDALDAPQFNDVAGLPPAPVLIFLVLTGGALSGMHALVASGMTARHIGRQQDVMPSGYLGVGLDSLVAVMVIAALVTGFSDNEVWRTVYGTWPTYGGLYVWVDLAITKIALAISALGIPLAWSVGLVAAMCMLLALSMLETALRILAGSVEEFVQDFEVEWMNTPRFKQQAAVALVGVAAFLISQSHVNLQHWLLLGIANQWFACLVMLLLGLVLWQARRPALFCWAPLAVIGPLSLWGTAWIMLQWVYQSDWGLFAVGATICLAGLFFLISAALSAARMRRQMAQETTVAPRF